MTLPTQVSSLAPNLGPPLLYCSRGPPAVEGGLPPGERCRELAICLRTLLGHELQLGRLTSLDGGAEDGHRRGQGRGLREGTLPRGDSKGPFSEDEDGV